jgi:hypothetical protein
MTLTAVIRVGDWIRFQQSGRLMVGIVQYLRPRSSWDSTIVYQTDIGVVCRDDILEMRRE